MHDFAICACISQDFAQSQKIFARSHDRMTVTFKNSDIVLKVEQFHQRKLLGQKTEFLVQKKTAVRLL